MLNKKRVRQCFFASIWLFGLIFHLIVGSIGLEPMKTKANRFTVYPVCHFGNYPFCGSRRIQTSEAFQLASLAKRWYHSLTHTSKCADYNTSLWNHRTSLVLRTLFILCSVSENRTLISTVKRWRPNRLSNTPFVEIQGFEPWIAEPKSAVLPLHHISICAKRRTRTPDNQVWNLTFFQLNYLRFIAPGDRIELPTFTLTVYCSTNWANRTIYLYSPNLRYPISAYLWELNHTV